MQFSSKEDIDAPIEAVFARIADFAAFERAAVRRGASVSRVVDHDPPQVGMSWAATFPLRGKQRAMTLTLTSHEPPEAMGITAVSEGIDATFDIELVALSPARTRLSVVLNLKPKSLPARLLIQSLRLAKSNLTKRFKLRVADFAKNLANEASSTA